MVAQAQGVFDTAGVFAGLILTSVVVLVIDLAIHRLERYLAETALGLPEKHLTGQRAA